MPVECQMQEIPEGLIITVRRSRSWLTTILETITTGTVFYFFISKSVNPPRRLSLLCAVAAALLYGVFNTRSRTATTVINKLEVRVSSPLKKWAGLDTSTAWATVTSLSFRKENNSGEGSSEPSGLYAEKEWGGVCLVPYIDLPETERLITAIEKRFPDLPFRSTVGGSALFRDDILRLNLK